MPSDPYLHSTVSSLLSSLLEARLTCYLLSGDVLAFLQAMQLFTFCSNVKEQIQEEQQDVADRLGQLAGVVGQFQGQMQGLQSYLSFQPPSVSAQPNQLSHPNNRHN